MCTKIQDFACKIPKFFRGLYPRTPSAGGGDPLPHPPPAWLRHARRRSAPRLRGPRPPLILQHPPKFKILYNTLQSTRRQTCPPVGNNCCRHCFLNARPCRIRVGQYYNALYRLHGLKLNFQLRLRCIMHALAHRNRTRIAVEIGN
jgi:hypothetical protein